MIEAKVDYNLGTNHPVLTYLPKKTDTECQRSLAIIAISDANKWAKHLGHVWPLSDKKVLKIKRTRVVNEINMAIPPR